MMVSGHYVGIKALKEAKERLARGFCLAPNLANKGQKWHPELPIRISKLQALKKGKTQ